MVRDSDFDMLALTETWLHGIEYDEYVARDCCPIGYTLHHVPRFGTTGGGVGAIIKNTFKVTRQELPCFKSFEHLVLLIKSTTFLVLLAIVYRTGPVPLLLASLELFLLVGDFNIQNDRTALQFVGLLETCNLPTSTCQYGYTQGWTHSGSCYHSCRREFSERLYCFSTWTFWPP